MLATGRELIQNGLVFGFSFEIIEIMGFKPKRTQEAGSIQDAFWGRLVISAPGNPFMDRSFPYEPGSGFPDKIGSGFIRIDF